MDLGVSICNHIGYKMLHRAEKGFLHAFLGSNSIYPPLINRRQHHQLIFFGKDDFSVLVRIEE